MSQFDTPITDAAEEADSYKFQILYPSCKYRGVDSDRMRNMEIESTKLREMIREYEEALSDGPENLSYARYEELSSKAQKLLWKKL